MKRSSTEIEGRPSRSSARRTSEAIDTSNSQDDDDEVSVDQRNSRRASRHQGSSSSSSSSSTNMPAPVESLQRSGSNRNRVSQSQEDPSSVRIFHFDTYDATTDISICKFEEPKEKEMRQFHDLDGDIQIRLVKNVVRLFLMRGKVIIQK